MPNSFAHTTELHCPHCSNSFSADIWFIVDTAERPDLTERIRTGSLHDLACPDCGRNAIVAAPLFVLTSAAASNQTVLLFSPAPTAESADAGLDLGYPLDLVMEWLNATRPAWMEEMQTVPRPQLAASLDRSMLPSSSESADDTIPTIHAPLDELATEGITIESQEDLDRLLAERPDLHDRFGKALSTAGPQLLRLLLEFVQASSWDESQRIIEANSELLSDEADAALSELIESWEQEGYVDAVTLLTEHIELLRHCRAVGIPRAFAEKLLPLESLAEAARQGLTPEAFLATQRAAAQMPPELRALLSELAAAGVEIRSQEDLEAALVSWPELRARLEEAIGESGSPQVPPEFARDLQQVQEAGQQYLRSGDLTALDAAAAAWVRILDAPAFAAADHRFQLAVMNDAGGVFLRRFWARGSMDDLNRALSCWRRAVAATAEGSPDLPSILNNLGTGLRTRFARTGRLEDLEEAIRVSQAAVAATAEGSPDLPARLNNLGTGLSTRFGRTGRLEDLEEAIRVYQAAVAPTAEGSPDLPMYLNNLGTGLSTRFGRTGRLEDLEEAIRVYQAAVAATAQGSPYLPVYLNNLGTGLRDPLWAHGAAGRSGRGDSGVPGRGGGDSGGVARPALYLNNLGNGLRDRFGRTGRLEDLEEAIRVYQRRWRRQRRGRPTCQCTSPTWATDCATALGARGGWKIWKRRFGCTRPAVAATAEGSPDLPMYLNNLGTGLSARFGRTGRLEDLEEAIRVSQAAVAATAEGSPDLPSRLNNLGNGLRDPLWAHGAAGRSGRGDSGVPGRGGDDRGGVARPALLPQ